MIRLVDGAVVWRSGLAVDGDGSAKCYAPAGSNLPTLDYLANAGSDGHWWALACDPHGQRYIQPNGYYVSTTSLQDHSKAVDDPARYVDSEIIPYITATRDMLHLGARLGDLAVVVYAGIQCSAIVADIGPHPGEGSIALAKCLSIPSNPKHGGISSPVVSFVVFTGSTRGWPRADITAGDLFATWGGMSRLGAELG